MKCYLPCRGEFGWMLVCFVKAFHSDSHTNKIICCKKGHECLFPSAKYFYYNWKDVPDYEKAGFSNVSDEDIIKKRIIKKFKDKDIEFVHLSEFGWHNKNNYANYNFIPKNVTTNNLKVDVVIAPRNRLIDPHRNWTKENWQIVVDLITNEGITVGLCGTLETSFELKNVLYRSYDYIDVDSDVELITNAKLVITQESGMQYLSFLCEKPTICIDNYHKDLGAELHRNPNIFFKNVQHVWDEPELLAEEIINFIKK